MAMTMILTYDREAMEREMLKKGWTFGDLADAAGIGRDTASRAVKDGRGSRATYRKIARALGVPLASLVPPPALIPAGGPSTTHAPDCERNGSAASPRVPRAAKRDRSDAARDSRGAMCAEDRA